MSSEDEHNEAVDVIQEDDGAGFKLDAFPEAVRPLMAAFDIDGSGEITAFELAHAATLLRDAQHSNKKLKRAVFAISGVLLLTLGTIFGLVWAVVSALKDTKTDDSGEMTVKGTSQLVSTSSVKTLKPVDSITAESGAAVLDTLDRYTIQGRTTASVAVHGWAKSVPVKGVSANLTLFTAEGAIWIAPDGGVYTDSDRLHKIFDVPDMSAPLNSLGDDEEDEVDASGRRLATTPTTTKTAAGAQTAGKPAAAPDPCPVGQQWVPKDKTCQDCPIGTFRNEFLQKTCAYSRTLEINNIPKVCPSKNQCVQCGIFSVASTVGASACKLCSNCQIPNSDHSKCFEFNAATAKTEFGMADRIDLQEFKLYTDLIAECKANGNSWSNVKKDNVKVTAFVKFFSDSNKEYRWGSNIGWTINEYKARVHAGLAY